jgi:Uma2 family endonuclease
MPIASPSLRATDPSPRLFDIDEYHTMGDRGFFRDQKVELIGGVVMLHTRDEGPVRRRWSREEYMAMDELGFFRDERVQLIGGEVLVLSPQSSWHFLAMEKVSEALKEALGAGFWVRIQGPLECGPKNEPEPDVSVVAGEPDDYRDRHPSSALLVVEVSATTLSYDCGDKASLYAAAGIPEYWVLNLVDRRLEVFRDPVTNPSQTFGWAYSQTLVVAPGATIAPSAFPKAKVAVDDLLP